MSSAKSPSGYGEAARVDIAALFSAGVNTTCETIQQTAERSEYGIQGKILEHLEGRKIPYKVKVLHVTPDLYPDYMEKGIYNIGRLMWETNRLPKEWVEPCNQMDEIWTASQPMAEMIRSSGVTTPCRVFPEPIYTQRADEEIQPFALEQPKDFIFYTIGQWIDRKNFKGLLRAYWKAFQDNEKVTLLLKTHRVNYSSSEYDFIRKDIVSFKNEVNLPQYPKIALVKNLLTDEQIVKLHKLGDCYVNASSGEGWCRPMQEAMLYGKPVISANNGGITDVMTSSHYFFVKSAPQQATVQSHIPWYTADMVWKQVDEGSLSDRMYEVYTNYTASLQTAKKAQQYIVDNFSYQTIGNQMKQRLEEIAKLL